MNNKIEKLKELYIVTSKHSNYQILPKKLERIVCFSNEVKIRNMFEKERLTYILNKVNVTNKKILDIGGNTGFFSIELINNGADYVHYYEGNKEHATFVQLASEILQIDERLSVFDEYFTFEKQNNTYKKKYDIILLLNVLHHFGDDYGDRELSISESKNRMLSNLNDLSYTADILVLQMGFNWKGNIEQALFKKGTKKEMIDFITNGIKGYWKVEYVGIAEERKNVIEYFDLNDKNILRIDSLGEFLNRPIFILKSLRCKK